MRRTDKPIAAAAGDNKDEREEERPLPPRSASHPTEKVKWTKMFYRTLITLFMLLIASLISWFLWGDPGKAGIKL